MGGKGGAAAVESEAVLDLLRLMAGREAAAQAARGPAEDTAGFEKAAKAIAACAAAVKAVEEAMLATLRTAERAAATAAPAADAPAEPDHTEGETMDVEGPRTAEELEQLRRTLRAKLRPPGGLVETKSAPLRTGGDDGGGGAAAGAVVGPPCAQGAA